MHGTAERALTVPIGLPSFMSNMSRPPDERPSTTRVLRGSTSRAAKSPACGSEEQ